MEYYFTNMDFPKFWGISLTIHGEVVFSVGSLLDQKNQQPGTLLASNNKK